MVSRAALWGRRVRPSVRQLAADRGGASAIEFAFIAPVLVVLMMGVFEMTMRYSASQSATRYAHQVADLVARTKTMVTQDVTDLYNASTNMMSPSDSKSQIDLDVASIGYDTVKVNGVDTVTPSIYWRRYQGAKVTFDVTTLAGMALANESVIRVGVTYRYTSPLSGMFGGSQLTFARSAISRPRINRLITMDGNTKEAQP